MKRTVSEQLKYHGGIDGIKYHNIMFLQKCCIR
jgi:hypothetical protein